MEESSPRATRHSSRRPHHPRSEPAPACHTTTTSYAPAARRTRRMRPSDRPPPTERPGCRQSTATPIRHHRGARAARTHEHMVNRRLRAHAARTHAAWRTHAAPTRRALAHSRVGFLISTVDAPARALPWLSLQDSLAGVHRSWQPAAHLRSTTVGHRHERRRLHVGWHTAQAGRMHLPVHAGARHRCMTKAWMAERERWRALAREGARGRHSPTPRR